LKTYVVETPIGIFALDENKNLIEKVLFPKDPEQIAEKIMRLQQGEAIEEILEMIENLKKRGVDEIIVESEDLASTLRKTVDALISVEKPSAGAQSIRARLPQLAKEFGIVETITEYIPFVQEISMIISKKKIREAAERRDRFVAQAIETIDDIDKTINLFASRIREWYSLHFPELDELVDEHRDFINLVAKLGLRSSFSPKKLKEIGLNDNLISKIMSAAKTSMGANVTERDIEGLRKLANIVLGLYRLRRDLEEYISETMDEVAPNIKGLVGPLLGARLISLAGSLEELAKMPSSTIQVLGAEKALFRALRTGAKPPKHGVIFQSPLIHRAPRWQRGKIARALAGKLAIAARVDAFSGQYIADELKEDLMKRIEEIRKKYPRPPKRKVERPREKKVRKKKKKRGGK